MEAIWRRLRSAVHRLFAVSPAVVEAVAYPALAEASDVESGVEKIVVVAGYMSVVEAFVSMLELSADYCQAFA